MNKFPEELGLFDLSSHKRTDGKYFNDLDKKFLKVNKHQTQQDGVFYNVSLEMCIQKFEILESFLIVDLYNASLPFNVKVLKDKVVEINCIIMGGVSISYKTNRVFISFTIIENYELLS